MERMKRDNTNKLRQQRHREREQARIAHITDMANAAKDFLAAMRYCADNNVSYQPTIASADDLATLRSNAESAFRLADQRSKERARAKAHRARRSQAHRVRSDCAA